MKRWLKFGLIAILLVVMVAIIISGYMAYSLTQVKRIPIEQTPTVFNLKYENVSFPSRDDKLILKGWFIKAKDSQFCIIMVHGKGGHRADASIPILDIAKSLAQHNFNALMFDLRGHGESEGNRLSLGYYERRDLAGAIDYLNKRGFPSRSIGILGFSMGAATALLLAAEDENVRTVVADSSFANLREILDVQLPKVSGLPRLFTPVMIFMAKVMLGMDLDKVRPIQAVGKIVPRPLLFIHGGRDTLTPVEHSWRLWNASRNSRSEIWIVPTAEHVEAYRTEPKQYLDRVVAFFNKALKQD